MFDKCIKCNRIGESCVPNLMLLPFHDLIQWCNNRQRYLDWSNQKLADLSKVPVGTINRIKAGEEDCRYSTIRSILITLIGGTSDEFSCTEQVARELQQVEQLAQQTAKLSATEKENEALKCRLLEIEEQHRKDIRAIRAEYREQITFLMDDLKAWQSLHKKQE